MFNYESDRPRDFRPDLLPLIKAWLEGVSPHAWQYFKSFGVGCNGSFAAHFSVPPTNGGPRREVSIKFDHNLQTLSNDIGIWTADHQVPFDMKNLQTVADTF